MLFDREWLRFFKVFKAQTIHRNAFYVWFSDMLQSLISYMSVLDSVIRLFLARIWIHYCSKKLRRNWISIIGFQAYCKDQIQIYWSIFCRQKTKVEPYQQLKQLSGVIMNRTDANQINEWADQLPETRRSNNLNYITCTICTCYILFTPDPEMPLTPYIL